MKISAKFVLLFALVAVVASVPVDYATYDGTDDMVPVTEREDMETMERGLEDPPEAGDEEDDVEWVENHDIDEGAPLMREEKPEEEEAIAQPVEAHQHADVEIKMS